MAALASGQAAGMTLEGEGIEQAPTNDAQNGVMNGNGLDKKVSRSNGV